MALVAKPVNKNIIMFLVKILAKLKVVTLCKLKMVNAMLSIHMEKGNILNIIESKNETKIKIK